MQRLDLFVGDIDEDSRYNAGSEEPGFAEAIE